MKTDVLGRGYYMVGPERPHIDTTFAVQLVDEPLDRLVAVPRLGEVKGCPFSSVRYRFDVDGREVTRGEGDAYGADSVSVRLPRPPRTVRLVADWSASPPAPRHVHPRESGVASPSWFSRTFR
ncbi:hypothetical protein [Pseudofrankia sp. BMG5.37]|uniref:hypothetical protein n=1 Tax=Pseudofrankia sp. BMG5.37 TaxID=3050035 RepID=UPI002893BAB3|nr:hypothetical protein [Pseudofrankia sp. BMG5.37]MDT3443834.1 hypothetical protein [Pseudofrankia sp. BMG5.37]